MTLIGHPIGDIDENLIIRDIYQLPNMMEGWYFLSLPSYQLISLDVDPNLEEVYSIGDKIYEAGYVPVGHLIPSPSGTPFPFRDVVFPSGLGSPFGRSARFWELYSDIDNPYLFVPSVDPNAYGEIVYVDIEEDNTIPKEKIYLPLKETVLSGMMLTFKEKLISDSTAKMSMKEKIISLLNVDLKLIDKTKVRLLWDGDEVDKLEILRRGIGESEYKTPIATVPFSPQYCDINIDNNSYTFTVRGTLGTGKSLNEVSIGMSGLTTMLAGIDLGDFAKYYDIDVAIIKTYEIDIGF